MDIRSLLSVWELETLASAASSTEPQGSSSPPQNQLPSPFARGTVADLYHGAQAPASARLLAQTGVTAYRQLQNVLANETPRNSNPVLSPDRLLSSDPLLSSVVNSEPLLNSESQLSSARLLTAELTASSHVLKAAYENAMSRLPSTLQAKDWSFSVSEDGLVFTPNEDPLSAQDLATLKRAFAAANVEPAAKQVATALTTLIQLRKSASNSDPPAGRRIDVGRDDTQRGDVDRGDANSSGGPADAQTLFEDAIELRAYLSGTAPGSKYHPPAATPAAPPPIPTVLGGMYLGELTTAKADFLRPDGSVATDADTVEESDATEPNTLLHGQCLCGSVRFTVENRLEYAFYCHCSRCRLRTGSVFAAIAGIGINKVQVTAGREDLLIEGDCADGYGARCSRCHVFLFAAVRGRQYMHVSLGVIDGAPNRLPDHHIYVGSKATWFRITDGLPQYDELP